MNIIKKNQESIFFVFSIEPYYAVATDSYRLLRKIIGREPFTFIAEIIADDHGDFSAHQNLKNHG